MELIYLNLLLMIALILGPLMTRKFFLNNSKIYGVLHLASLFIVGLAFILDISKFYLAWPLFCLFGFFLYAQINHTKNFNLKSISQSVPLVFSIIASVWLYSGANKLFLLGYNEEWSYYAALHGNYLGWLFIGLITIMSDSFEGVTRKIYLLNSFVFLFLFLLIAFGIDGVPFIKRIGTLGVVLAAPLLVGNYALSLWSKRSISFYLSALSFICLAASLTLASLNQFGLTPPDLYLGAPFMVSIHGLLNGLIAIPSLYFALLLNKHMVHLEN